MNRRRAETTGAILIFVMIVSILTVVVPIEALGHADIILVPEDYPTIQEAIDAASDGDTILVGPGEWYGGIVDKPVRVTGMRGAVIVDGEPYLGPGMRLPPQPWHFGLFITPEGSGSTISHFTFRCEPIGDTGTYLFAPVFARNGTDNLVITHNRIYIANIPQSQCITNWDGNNWVITHNAIITKESIGSFEGIVIASAAYCARGSNDNVVACNTIIADALITTGITLHVRVNITAGEVSNNKVMFNKLLVTGPETSAIEFWVHYFGEGPTPCEVVHDNIVMLNDLRGSTNPFVFLPPELEEANTVLFNLV